MPRWTWKEIEVMWQHPDWTAKELTEVIPHSEQGIRAQRKRYGRYNSKASHVCCKCDERPVWLENKKAKRYGLCKGCYLDEERMRLEEEAKSVAVRKLRRRVK